MRRFFRLPWRSPRQIRSDIDDELSFHIDERVDALVAFGHSPESARAQALREFGDIEDARRYIGAVDRDIEAAQRRSDLMNDVLQDIVYAMRKLRAAPGFTIAAIITLALGIGANTAIFSVVNTVLLQPLPFPKPDHLVRIRFRQQGHGDAGTPMDLIDYRTQARQFSGFALMEGTTANIARDNADAQRVQGARVSANWFDILGARPLVGRFFVPGEDQIGARHVIVLSEELWRREYGADTSIVGRTLRVNAEPFTVVGIAPTGRHYPVTVEAWMPTQFDARTMSDESRGARWLGLLGRIRDGADAKLAAAEVTRISEAMEKRYPEMFRERRAQAVELQDFMVGDLRKPLYLILGAVALVLLIACANVANLLLVRASAREGEMAIRAALGAGRGRLVRQLMTESVLLAIVGAVVGVAVARIGMAKLLAKAPPTLVLAQKASIDGTTLAVTAFIAILTGLVFGALPAMQANDPEVATTLRAGGRGALNRPHANRTKRTIVVAELALAVMLLSGAGLLLRSFGRLMSVDPGFNPDGVITMKVLLPEAKYDSTTTANFIREAETRARALPGVQTVALANMVPLDGGSYDFTFTIRGRPAARPSDEPGAEVRTVTPDFFRVLGMPVIRGRGFTTGDVNTAPHVYMVNESFAKKFFPHDEVIGQSIRLGWGNDPRESANEIVGVVGDVHSFGLEEAPEPTVYASLAQYPEHGLTILARSPAPANLATPLRGLVRDIDREVPVYSVMTMRDRVGASIGAQRFYATLIAIFASVALVLAAVGLYGVIAYAVGQRTRELGVRVALGATADRISRMVIGEGLVLTALGLAIGVSASLAMGSLVSSLLFGVSARDPATLAAVVVALGAVATLASWLPARRAARVDPLVAMRGE
ncbi:MAG TPA: ABC transporter permease [Gemmatimonadaceae bacterium]|nr:ABC transporter permease [Gemmatimonadaceae bacterium]